MIVPMKKVCLVVQDSFCDIALDKLRDIGVLHLERKEIYIDINSHAQRRRAKVDDAIGLIRDFKLKKAKQKKKKKADPEDDIPPHERRQKPVGLHRGRRATDLYGTEEEEPFSLSAVTAPARPELSDYMLTINKERTLLKEREFFLTNEIKRIQPWGNFDPHIIHEMIENNVPVYLYELFPDDYERIKKDTVYIKVQSTKSIVHIVVFENEIKGIAPFSLPEKSLNEYEEELVIIKHEIDEYNEKMKAFANRRKVLDKELVLAEQEIEFENAIAYMEKVNSESGGLDIDSSKLSWLTGFLPTENIELVKIAAKENSWGLSIYDPNISDEKVPTKLRNNKVVSLLSPVTGFLGLIPGYHEVDISPFFLFFFVIFFGMIFGDAAYGIIIVLMGIAGIFLHVAKNSKIKEEKKKIPQAFILLLVLGISNTIWGVLTCSWFAIEVEKLPQILRDISLPMISTAYNSQALVDKNIQFFCFTLGLFHLAIAHIINFIRYIKSPRFLAEIGSISMLLGIYNLVLFLIVDPSYIIMDMNIAIYLIGGGFALNFIFSGYVRNIGQSALSGLKNIIPLISGVINIFADVMSYIRLWAVGLAGASIAITINTLAGPTLGGFMIFAGIIILAAGHGLNMILNVLSMLVHGVRLNTLEFSGHVGLGWSGLPYQPFVNKVIKKNL